MDGQPSHINEGSSLMKHQAARSCDYHTVAKNTEEQVTVQEQDNASPENAQLAKRVIRKIDLRTLLVCFVTCNFNFMDKTVLSSAAVYGLTEDAVCLSLSFFLRLIPSEHGLTTLLQKHLHGSQYAWISSFFYVGFLVNSWPTAYLIQRLPIGIYLPAVVVVWGALVAATAGCTSYGSFTAIRLLLGMAEATISSAFV